MLPLQYQKLGNRQNLLLPLPDFDSSSCFTICWSFEAVAAPAIVAAIIGAAILRIIAVVAAPATASTTAVTTTTSAAAAAAATRNQEPVIDIVIDATVAGSFSGARLFAIW